LIRNARKGFSDFESYSSKIRFAAQKSDLGKIITESYEES